LPQVRSGHTTNLDSSIRSDSDCFLLQIMCTLRINFI
jgi:hypothetical protein